MHGLNQWIARLLYVRRIWMRADSPPVVQAAFMCLERQIEGVRKTELEIILNLPREAWVYLAANGYAHFFLEELDEQWVKRGKKEDDPLLEVIRSGVEFLRRAGYFHIPSLQSIQETPAGISVPK